MPLTYKLIISGRSIQSFRHLENQNPSTGDDFIQRSGIICLVLFLATKEALAPFPNNPIMSGRSIQSFRHLEYKNLPINVAIGYCSWGCKNITENRQEKTLNTGIENVLGFLKVSHSYCCLLRSKLSTSVYGSHSLLNEGQIQQKAQRIRMIDTNSA